MTTRIELLHYFDALLRSMPERSVIRQDTPDNLAWFGQAQALMDMWDQIKALKFAGHLQAMRQPNAIEAGRELAHITTALHQARSSLMLETGGDMNVSVPAKSPHTYFDEVRKNIARAREEVFFIDPYLEAEFVATYLPFIPKGVKVRLLGEHKTAQLFPAAKLFMDEHGIDLQLRTFKTFHDRLLFIDNKEGFHSSASFKDGGKAPSLVVQIVDTFAPTKAVYEGFWDQAEVKI